MGPAERLTSVEGIANVAVVAVQASREIVIDASPEQILDVIADLDDLVSWSPLHKRMEVLDKYDNGRPRHVQATIKLLGLTDNELLEYHWGPDWMVWDAKSTQERHVQHVEYTLKRDGLGHTRVRFDVTVEPSAPVPEFLVRRARKVVLHTATDLLRTRVMAAAGANRQV